MNEDYDMDVYYEMPKRNASRDAFAQKVQDYLHNVKKPIERDDYFADQAIALKLGFDCRHIFVLDYICGWLRAGTMELWRLEGERKGEQLWGWIDGAYLAAQCQTAMLKNYKAVERLIDDLCGESTKSNKFMEYPLEAAFVYTERGTKRLVRINASCVKELYPRKPEYWKVGPNNAAVIHSGIRKGTNSNHKTPIKGA
jgi:hypothetical protein